MVETVVECRSCGAGGLLPILSLGDTPLANALLTKAQLSQPEPKFPLDLVLCSECSLLQITATIPGVDEATTRALVEAAHQLCPYSVATRGNVDVTLQVATADAAAGAAPS